MRERAIAVFLVLNLQVDLCEIIMFWLVSRYIHVL